jgi:hypothetical protein
MNLRRLFSSYRLLPCYHAPVQIYNIKIINKSEVKKPKKEIIQQEPPKVLVCERCGREGHPMKYCVAKYDVNGTDIEDDERGY